MARTVASLPEGSRITDYISLGVITKTFPMRKIHSVLAATGTASVRQRDLPAHVVVYYVIALALYMHSSYREVLRCLLEGGQWRLVSLDGSTLDVADEAANDEAFGRPGASRGSSAYPQIRFVSLVENGTHVLFGSQMAAYGTSEVALAKAVLAGLQPGMLCLADRLFFGFQLWKLARETGADLLWRIKKNMRLACENRLPDGSYLSRIYPSVKDWRRKTNGVQVRVIDYRMHGVADAEPIYRLVTTILDHTKSPAAQLAALYHERWEIETALDELKTHLRGAKIVLRSKTPDLVRQEIYGLLLAHFAIRGLMHEAALKAEEDPDRLSFIHTVRVMRRKIAAFG